MGTRDKKPTRVEIRAGVLYVRALTWIEIGQLRGSELALLTLAVVGSELGGKSLDDVLSRLSAPELDRVRQAAAYSPAAIRAQEVFRRFALETADGIAPEKYLAAMVAKSIEGTQGIDGGVAEIVLGLTIRDVLRVECIAFSGMLLDLGAISERTRDAILDCAKSGRDRELHDILGRQEWAR